MKKDMVMGALCVIVGLLCLLWFGPARQARKDVCTEYTIGTVTSVLRSSDPDSSSYSYNITVEYETDGQKHTYRGSSSASAEMGEELKVWYDPADPDTCYVEMITSQPFMIRLAGVVFTAVGAVTVISALIKNKRAEG